MKKTLLTVLLSLAFLFLFSGRSHAQDFVTFGLTAQAVACPTNPGNTSTSTSAVTIDTLNYGGASFTIGSTAFSGTVTFYGSGDGGTTWQTLNVFPSNSTTPVTTATAAGLWQANVSAYTKVCMLATTFSSGTITVTIRKATVSARAGGGGGGGAPAGATNYIQTNNGSGGFSSVALPTTPNSRAEVLTSTPSGGVGQASVFGLPGDSPTDRPSGEASYTIAVTDIGTSIRETNAAGEAFTIPDGNTSGFVLPVNIGFIIEGGTSTIARTTSSQIRCTPNGALANSCNLAAGAQYILKETSDFNYTLSVAGDFSGIIAQNIHETDLFCHETGGTTFGTHQWSGNGTGQSVGGLNGVSAKYPCGIVESAAATSGDWNYLTWGGVSFSAPQYQYWNGSDLYFAFQRQNASAAPQEIFEVGLGDASVTAQIANFVGLRVVATAAKADFFAVCRASAVDGTTVDSTILEDTATHFVHIHVTSQNSVTVALDGGSALSLTSGCPAVATHMGPVFYISTSETVAKTVWSLFWEWDNTVTRP